MRRTFCMLLVPCMLVLVGIVSHLSSTSVHAQVSTVQIVERVNVAQLIAQYNTAHHIHAPSQHMHPLADGPYDGQGPAASGCQYTTIAELKHDNVYVAGHLLGVLHLYHSQDCETVWSGFRIDNAYCEWQPTSYIGHYNTKEVSGIEGYRSPSCGIWESSRMDEYEPYLGYPACESAWHGGSTGFNGGTNYMYKLIWTGPFASGC